MNETICEHERGNTKFSFPHLKSKNSPIWYIEIDHHSFEDRDYRDRIRMYKDGCNSNKILTIICFNPGKLHSKKEQVYRDTTLRIIREVFENSNHTIEILNLLNLNQTKIRKMKIAYQNRHAINYNPIEKYLREHKPGHLVFVQWGKEENKVYAKEEFNKIRQILIELKFNIKSLPEDGDYMHPINWQRNNMIPECKHHLEEILRPRNEKAKEIRKSLNPIDTCLPRQ